MFNNDELDHSRAPVPDTNKLQASIIAAAECVPQQVAGRTSPPPRARRRWLHRFSFAAPITACCVIALLIAGSGIEFAEDKNVSFTQSEEQDWQQIMLLEDEWLLADL